jgi:hypothetical protein
VDGSQASTRKLTGPTACRFACSSAPQDFHTINFLAGFCTCWDYAQHQVCGHLLAVLQSAATSALCAFELQLPAAADAAQRVLVKRATPLPLAAGAQEPLDVLGDSSVGQLLQQLAAAAKPAEGDPRRNSSSRAQPASELSKEWQRHAAQLVANGKYMSDAQLQELMTPMRQLAERSKALQPRFAEQSSAGRQTSRRDSDRVVKPLYAGRNRGRQQREDGPLLPAAAHAARVPGAELLQGLQGSSIAAATPGTAAAGAEEDKEEDKKFAKLQEPGRPRTRVRQLGEMTRSSKRSYPQRMPRNKEQQQQQQPTMQQQQQQNKKQSKKKTKKHKGGKATRQ